MGWVSGIDAAASQVSAIVLPQIDQGVTVNAVSQKSSQGNGSDAPTTEIYPLNLVTVLSEADNSNVVDDQIDTVYIPLVHK